MQVLPFADVFRRLQFWNKLPNGRKKSLCFGTDVNTDGLEEIIVGF